MAATGKSRSIAGREYSRLGTVDVIIAQTCCALLRNMFSSALSLVQLTEIYTMRTGAIMSWKEQTKHKRSWNCLFGSLPVRIPFQNTYWVVNVDGKVAVVFLGDAVVPEHGPEGTERILAWFKQDEVKMFSVVQTERSGCFPTGAFGSTKHWLAAL